MSAWSDMVHDLGGVDPDRSTTARTSAESLGHRASAERGRERGLHGGLVGLLAVRPTTQRAHRSRFALPFVASCCDPDGGPCNPACPYATRCDTDGFVSPSVNEQ